MTYTSPSEINATKGIGTILEYINEVTYFWMSRMLMVVIFVLFTVGYLRSKNDDDVIGAIAVGGYASFVIGILFWIIGFLDTTSLGMIIGVTVLATAGLLMDRRGN